MRQGISLESVTCQSSQLPLGKRQNWLTAVVGLADVALATPQTCPASGSAATGRLCRQNLSA